MRALQKATGIEMFNLQTPSMRAFHMTWFSFFLCFFGWFGIAPLMAVVREEFQLTKTQVGNTIIASVAITILARLLIGWVCDRVGPRLTYTWLLILGALPVMGIGFSQNYEMFLLCRLAIGAIGASFVITQYHTSMMFAPNCVGTANATTAGWGNLGGGVTQMVMPLIFALFIGLGFSDFWSWRLAMIIPGILMLLTGIAYYFFTQDTIEGNYAQLRQEGKLEKDSGGWGPFLDACKDHRVWVLFIIYAACFGIELTINNIAAIYYHDHFGLGLAAAGLIAGLYGLMNIFSRSLGGLLGDRFGIRFGLRGRVYFMGAVLFLEGLSLMVFSQMNVLPLAILTMLIFGLFVQMSSGATYCVVPFINKRALGSVAGIVGAGGNVGAVAAGFLFRAESLSMNQALLILGVVVAFISGLTVLVRFSASDEAREEKLLQEALAQRALAPVYVQK